jgi:DNA-binding XRE family transcriptional regulator
MDSYQDTVTGIVSDAVGMIEIWRNKRGLTRCALARKAHIGRQTVANVEKVTKDPGLAMIVRLWLVLEIPPKELTKIIRRHVV